MLIDEQDTHVLTTYLIWVIIERSHIDKQRGDTFAQRPAEESVYQGTKFAT